MFDFDGDKFFMINESRFGVHQAKDAKLVTKLECQKRVLCATPGEVSFVIAALFYMLYEMGCCNFHMLGY